MLGRHAVATLPKTPANYLVSGFPLSGSVPVRQPLTAITYFEKLTTAGWAREFQQASKSLASGSPSVMMKR